jgi:predicted Abi (CAAX) family protease
LSNLNFATFLQRPEGLARRERPEDWGVLTGFAHDHRERGYKVIAEASMKQTIQDWSANAGRGNINNMTLVFVAHGHPVFLIASSKSRARWAGCIRPTDGLFLCFAGLSKIATSGLAGW